MKPEAKEQLFAKKLNLAVTKLEAQSHALDQRVRSLQTVLENLHVPAIHRTLDHLQSKIDELRLSTDTMEYQLGKFGNESAKLHAATVLLTDKTDKVSRRLLRSQEQSHTTTVKPAAGHLNGAQAAP